MSECPICFEVMKNDSNNIKTECGHEFHSNCFLANVAHNGFNCPCCRKELARRPCSCEMSDSDDDILISDSDSDSDNDNDDDESESSEEIFAEPPLHYTLNKLKDNFSKHDLLTLIINYYNRNIIEEYLYIDEKMLDSYTKVTEEYDRLEEEEREIELMKMEDKNCNEKEEIKLIDDFNTIIDMRVY
jgi:hypothetical protein